MRHSAAPMTALALLMVPVLVIPLIRPVHGAVALSLLIADYVIWVLFGLDYFVRLYLAPERRAFVRGHLMDLAVVALPFLRPLRALRAMGGLRVVTASIASYFVEQDERDEDRRIEERLDEILAVLHRLEARMDALEGSGPPRP